MTETDAPAAAALLRDASLEFFLDEGTPEAAEFFIRENDEEAMRKFMRTTTVYYKAMVDGRLAGFIAIRENRHLFHMFVAKPYHRRGIAIALWRHARQCAVEQGNPGLFTVNASNYALPVYERMGFVRTAPTQCKNGIYFNPMQLDERANVKAPLI